MVRIVAAIVSLALAAPALAQQPTGPYAPGGWSVETHRCGPTRVFTKQTGKHGLRSCAMADGSCG